MRKEPTITNYIEIDGKKRKFDDLPAIERERIGILLSDRFMEAAGYRRFVSVKERKSDVRNDNHSYARGKGVEHNCDKHDCNTISA